MSNKKIAIPWTYRFRLLNRLYAFLHGYFWKPCFRCGRAYGGHEIIGRAAIIISGNAYWQHSKCVCPVCEVQLTSTHKTFFYDLNFNPIDWDKLEKENKEYDNYILATKPTPNEYE